MVEFVPRQIDEPTQNTTTYYHVFRRRAICKSAALQLKNAVERYGGCQFTRLQWNYSNS